MIPIYSRADSHSRSRSPSRQDGGRDRHKHRRREDDAYSEEEHRALPHSAKSISESDYFLKNSEFKAWLKEEKHRYFDELSGEKARSYFRKFVKAWNRGKLPKSYYTGINEATLPASSQTGYRWSFASKRSRAELDELDATRNEVEAATQSTAKNGDKSVTLSRPSQENRAPRPGRMVGPTMPQAEDHVLLREAQEEARAAERAYDRRRSKMEEKERVEDLVGPKEHGREGMLEKKKARRENEKAFRDMKDDAFGNYDESALLGVGDSFQARIAQRDTARRRFEEKRLAGRQEKLDAVRERQEAMRAKDSATMEMFKQLAREKFGD